MRNKKDHDDTIVNYEKSLGFFQDIILCSGDWVWEINEQFQYVFVDGNIDTVLGYKPSQIIGKSMYDFIPETEKANFVKKITEYVNIKKPIIDFESWQIASNGIMKRILTNAIPVHDDHGNYAGYRGVHKDITEKYNLAREVEVLASFPNENPYPILRVKIDGEIIFCNRAGKSLLKRWNVKIGDSIISELRTIVSDVVRVNFPCNFEISFYDIYYSYTVVPVSNSNYVNLYFYEITDRKKTEAELSKSEERYRLAQNAARIGNWEWNIDDNSMYFSDIVVDIYELERKSWKTFDAFLDCVHPDDLLEFREAIDGALKNKAEFNIEHRIITPDGKIKWIAENGLVTRNFSGKPVRMTGLVRDITKFKNYEEELLVLSRGIEQSPASILFTDVSGIIQYVNPRFSQMTGYSESDVSGKNPNIMKSGFHPKAFYEELWNTITSGKEWHGEFCNLKKNGEEIWVLSSISPIIDKKGKIIHYLFVGEDITEKHKHDEQIKHMALHDNLTGLPNRIFLRDRLEQALNRSSHTKRKSALMYIDLDKFKPINDRYGHEEGDNILRLVADRIRSCLRKMDTAARLGGDEFAVILEDIQDGQHALTLAGRMLNVLGRPIHISNEEYQLGASIGIAVYPDHGDQIDLLISNADKAMYLVKKNGRNNVRLYESL